MPISISALIIRAQQRLNLTPVQRSVLRDGAIVLFLFLLALALRLPYLHDVPRYPWDELRETRVALSILRGEAFPLTNFDGYIGALYNYILAGAFLVFGEHPVIPHLVVAFISSATAPVVYLFGKEIDNRTTGFIAATLLCCNAQQIFNGSHFGYSNSLTPAFTTLALWLICRALKGKRPWSFVAGAFTFGLALQTHPTAVVLVPAIVTVFFLGGRPWLRGRWPVLVIGAASLGCANVIAYNLTTFGGGVVAGLAQREIYASGRPLTLGLYPAHFLRGIGMFLRLFEASGIWPSTPVPWWPETLLLQVSPICLLVGCVLLVLRRQYLIPITLISSIVLLPLLLAYQVDWYRYWMLALPPGLVAIAFGITSAVRWVGALRRSWPVYSVTALCVAILAAHPLPALWRMYAVRSQVHPTNREMDRLAALVLNAVRPGEVVLIYEFILAQPKPDESSEARTLSYLLLLSREGTSLMVLRESAESPFSFALAHPDQTYLLVVPSSTPIPDNMDHSVGAKANPFEIDPRSPAKELGLAVTLVHFRSN